MALIISLIEEINGHQGVHMATLEWASRSSEGTKCYSDQIVRIVSE